MRRLIPSSGRFRKFEYSVGSVGRSEKARIRFLRSLPFGRVTPDPSKYSGPDLAQSETSIVDEEWASR